jgi:hypothetical protein
VSRVTPSLEFIVWLAGFSCLLLLHPKRRTNKRLNKGNEIFGMVIIAAYSLIDVIPCPKIIEFDLKCKQAVI